MKEKIGNIIIVALFLIPLYVLGLWSLLGEKPLRSEIENRTFESLPAFSLTSFLFDTFTDRFRDYYSDTFPLREQMLSANREMNRFYYFNPPFASQADENVTLFIAGAGTQIAEGGEALPPPDDFRSQNLMLPESDTSPNHRSDSIWDNNQISPPTSADETIDFAANGEEIEAIEPEPEPPPLPELETGEADLNTGAIIIVGDRAMEIMRHNQQVIDMYAQVINRYASAMPDARIISLVSPNGGAFYAPEDYRTGEYDQQAIINTMYELLDEGIVAVDAYTHMRPHVDEYMFFRTDHHWTQLGAYYAYTAFCHALGFEIVSLDEFETGEYPGFLGSMYSYTSGYPQSSGMRDNPDTIHWWRPTRVNRGRVYWGTVVSENGGFEISLVAESTSASNKYLIFTSGDNPLIHITTGVGNGRKIVVIKESYGNAFVPFMVNHYDEVFVIDPRKFNGTDLPYLDLASFVANYEIDDVLIINYPMVLADSGYLYRLDAIVR